MVINATLNLTIHIDITMTMTMTMARTTIIITTVANDNETVNNHDHADNNNGSNKEEEQHTHNPTLIIPVLSSGVLFRTGRPSMRGLSIEQRSAVELVHGPGPRAEAVLAAGPKIAEPVRGAGVAASSASASTASTPPVPAFCARRHSRNVVAHWFFGVLFGTHLAP